MMEIHSINFHISQMHLALDQAQKAFNQGEVPIGAIVTEIEKEDKSFGHNKRRSPPYDPLGHAEIIAIRNYAKDIKKDWRLMNCYLYVTVEPCPMCMSAIIQARIKKVIFGAYDQKGGAISLGFNLHQNKKLNHQVEVIGGILELECAELISKFFKERRSEQR